jgi:predicted ATPase
MLTHIEFENYRIFKKRQALDIKPITLLFGKNNAGKSAVLKLPMLGLTIQHSEDPENFNISYNGVRICDTYLDLVYGKGSSAAYLKYSNGTNETEIKFHIDIDRLVYDLFEHRIEDKSLYTIVDYIGSFRKHPELDLRIEPQIPKGSDGTNTYQVLLRDAKTPSRFVCNKVSKWYQDNFEGWSVEVNDRQNPIYHIEMKNNGFSIPIQDCGTGILQSLPIVIRACQPAEKPTLVVLEEPESHLNPAAHAELCQLIVDSTKDDSNKRYLIETHSHTFILRLQRLLAEGKISPDDVALYFVQYHEEERSSQLERIEMKEDGSIPQWPKGMFLDVMKELLAINKARK